MNEPEPRRKLPWWAMVLLGLAIGIVAVIGLLVVAVIVLYGFVAYSCSKH